MEKLITRLIPDVMMRLTMMRLGRQPQLLVRPASIGILFPIPARLQLLLRLVPTAKIMTVMGKLIILPTPAVMVWMIMMKQRLSQLPPVPRDLIGIRLQTAAKYRLFVETIYANQERLRQVARWIALPVLLLLPNVPPNRNAPNIIGLGAAGFVRARLAR